METAKVLASNLKRLRGYREWTQADLCEKSKVNLAAIQSYESCRKWPGDETLDALAKAFDVSVTELFRDPNYDVLFFFEAFQKATRSQRLGALEVLRADDAKSGARLLRSKAHK